MQRTAVIYGLALSTLIGAFFLAPRLKPDPIPEPEPIPQPESKLEPVTELIYSDGVIEARARLDRGLLMNHAGEPVWMDIALTASGVQTRAPLTSVLVVDWSGSMAGDKIDAARMAAERFVNGLRDGDALGIVTFGTDVTVDLPIAIIDTKTRARALSVVRRIEEGGGTNIDGGMLAARNLLAQGKIGGTVGRVVLVSDGRPTEGDRRESVLVKHATELRSRGIVTSTLGLGLDYNEDLMEHMAVEGGGRYHYAARADDLTRILNDELQHVSNVVATGVRLYLPRNEGGVEVIDAPGSRIADRTSSRVAIDVGDLAAGEERHVLVKVMVSPSGDSISFKAPEVVYRKVSASDDALLAHRADPFRMIVTSDPAALELSRKDDVRVRVLQIEASLALTESMQSYAKGDAAGARVRLQTKKAELTKFAAKAKSATLAAEAANFDNVLETVNAAPAASTEKAQDLIKDQKARAFQLRR